MISKYLKVVLSMVMSIGILNVLPIKNVHAAGSYDCNGEPGVYIYKDSNYSGTCKRFVDAGDYNDLNSLGVYNDTASSIKIVNGIDRYEAVLFEHTNFQGRRSAYRFSSENLGLDTIGNDTLTSLKIRKISQSDFEGVYLFDFGNWHGDWIKLNQNISDLRALSFNDRTSSVRVEGHYTAYVFHEGNYIGPNLQIDWYNWSWGGKDLYYRLFNSYTEANNSISSVMILNQ